MERRYNLHVNGEQHLYNVTMSELLHYVAVTSHRYVARALTQTWVVVLDGKSWSISVAM